MTDRPKITLSKGTHREAPVVFIHFEYNLEVITCLKEKTPAQWSKSKGCWYIPEKRFDLHDFFEGIRDAAYIDYTEMKTSIIETKEEKENYIDTPKSKKADLPGGYMEMLEQKRYSENTKKVYTSYMRDFATMFRKYDLKDVTKDQINRYILWLIREKGISASQQNQRINAIKFYYEKVHGRPRELYAIDRPRKGRRLPEVLGKEEVKAMLAATENKKHKCLIALIYTCGLRRSEAINLKLEDIDSERMMIRIRGAKGDKDRYVNFPDSLLVMLRDYHSEYLTHTYLFEGQKGGTYSPESVWKVIKQVAWQAGIRKRVYPHILRHSFATHHIEQGIDIRYIQEWMGHESIITTQRYTHVTNGQFKFKNLLDDLLQP